MEQIRCRVMSEFPTYVISADGQIGGPSGRWLKASPDRDGYPRVVLYVKGRRIARSVHWLVCTAFHGDRPPGMEARHLDGIPANNEAGNLCWSTHQENCADKMSHGTYTQGETHHRSKLTAADVRGIRLRVANGEAMRSVGRSYGVVHRTIQAIVRRETWVSVED